jgi:outer membrane cobalamin receptor
MRIALICGLWLIAESSLAQNRKLVGVIVDASTSVPIEGATINVLPENQKSVTDERGVFHFKEVSQGSVVTATCIGYSALTLSVLDLAKSGNLISLSSKAVQLSDVRISSRPGDQYRVISTLDIKTRGINNSQEVLRMVPGLFIGQHAGGGKAEQMFLRGFDLDHGTDINIGVDGIPVNMVSHAHGQGYADLHFLIPELINNVIFKKGPYYAEKGNFTTTGSVEFKTFNSLPNNSIKVEAGMFNTIRTVAALNLLNEKWRSKGQSGYVAAEYVHSNGYFDNPQHFHRINVFGKYFGALSKNNHLTVSASTFSSKWDASGQIPERAVESGMIGFYGAIDPTEGGQTSRTNLNGILTTGLRNGSSLKNQVYFSNYHFELYSNFTFYKIDSVNGDQIRQKESRNLFGYDGSYNKTFFVGSTQAVSEIGLNARLDRTDNSELSHAKDRSVTLNRLMLGDISENNLAAYMNEVFTMSSSFEMTAGLRYDYFHDSYLDKLNNNAVGKASASILSPRLNFSYHPNQDAQFYFALGRGFHSNDARVVVPQNGLKILPAAYGADLGTILKPAKNLLIHAAVWYLWLQQEFVYVGDEAIVEPRGKTERYGTDLSLRYQPLKWLYADIDFNYSHARSVEEPKGQNYLPLSPTVTSTGGITIKTNPGVNVALRYRYMGDRPANETNSVIAKGYFVTDASVSYPKKKYELGLTIQNMLNVKWKETQFYTESRLMNEPAPVSEIHFTAGTPFFAKMSFTYFL